MKIAKNWNRWRSFGHTRITLPNLQQTVDAQNKDGAQSKPDQLELRQYRGKAETLHAVGLSRCRHKQVMKNCEEGIDKDNCYFHTCQSLIMHRLRGHRFPVFSLPRICQ